MRIDPRPLAVPPDRLCLSGEPSLENSRTKSLFILIRDDTGEFTVQIRASLESGLWKVLD